MHGRTFLALSLAIACLVPATAVAAPLPAGTYDVTLQDGTLKIGDGLLPAIPIHSGSTFVLAVGTDPISAPIGLTYLSGPVSESAAGFSFDGTVSVTVLGAGITFTPATGEATIDASFYGSVTGTGSVLGISTSGTCTVGSALNPINSHFSTTAGSPWDSATGAFSAADKTFGVPTPACSGLFSSLVGLVLGNTGPGQNFITMNGIALRHPDPVAPPVTTTQGTTSPTGGTTTAPTSPEVVQNTAAPVATKFCVVPKLVGKTLKQAKRALKKAGCKVGKSKKQKSKKKKGRIVKQRYKAGKKLPAGTKIPISVSRGPKKARSHRSR